MITCPFEDLVVKVLDRLLGNILGDLYVCSGVEEMIVKGPADVLGGVDANWSKICICVSNDDFFIATNGSEDLCLKLCDVQPFLPRSKLSPDCTVKVTDLT